MKGLLLNDLPYKITKNGSKNSRGIKVVIGVRSGLKVGDKVYQLKLDNGVIMLIPEKVYFKEYE